jgi:hypothetical protein
VFTIRVDSTHPYLSVIAEGPASFAECCGLAALVGELVKTQRHQRVLGDLSAVEPALSFTEHLLFATMCVELLGRLERLAVVVPPGYVDAPAVRAAHLAGLRLKTFLQVRDAKAWLEEPAPSRAKGNGGPDMAPAA